MTSSFPCAAPKRAVSKRQELAFWCDRDCFGQRIPCEAWIGEAFGITCAKHASLYSHDAQQILHLRRSRYAPIMDPLSNMKKVTAAQFIETEQDDHNLPKLMLDVWEKAPWWFFFEFIWKEMEELDCFPVTHLAYIELEHERLTLKSLWPNPPSRSMEEGLIRLGLPIEGELAARFSCHERIELGLDARALCSRLNGGGA